MSESYEILRDRRRGMIWGALIADALGVPFEFREPLDRYPELANWLVSPAFETPPAWVRTYPHVPAGTWSDDGAQVLALFDAVGRPEGYADSVFVDALLAWHRRGAYTPDGVVFDVGIQTASVLRGWERGQPPPADDTAQGNGCIMRFAGLPAAFAGTIETLDALARAQARVTHPSERAADAAALLCRWAYELVHGEHTSLVVPPELRAAVAAWGGRPNGGGWLADTLATVCLAFDDPAPHDNLWLAHVMAAVRLGNDSDSTAAVVGGLMGAFVGERGLPPELCAGLRGRPVVEALLARLDHVV